MIVTKTLWALLAAAVVVQVADIAKEAIVEEPITLESEKDDETRMCDKDAMCNSGNGSNGCNGLE